MDEIYCFFRCAFTRKRFRGSQTNDHFFRTHLTSITECKQHKMSVSFTKVNVVHLFLAIRDVNGPVRSVLVRSSSVRGLGPDRRPGPIGPIGPRSYRSVL